MSDERQKKLALKFEIGRAMPGAPESVIERIFKNRVAVLNSFELNAAGYLVSLGGGSIKDEIEAMRQSGAYDDLFSEDQPAVSAKEPAADKRPRELTADDYASLPHEARLLAGLGTAPPAKQPKLAPASTGMDPAQFAKLSPEAKLAAANAASAKANGWDYSGFNKDR